jgi:hypothetical protein
MGEGAMMTDQPGDKTDKDKAARPELNAIGLPEPKREQPVEPFIAGDKPHGERQDGPGAAPDRPERHDALPVGRTAARRAGADAGAPEEPDAGHRGQPAPFASGAATGSGSGAGGGGTGMVEEPDPDSAGGGGRERGFAADRKAASREGDGR